jgi:hypothetical protein
MECKTPAEVADLLKQYRPKTLRLVRTFFDDIASRLEARTLLQPHAKEMKEVRDKLRSADGDFSFQPALAYPKVCL